MKIFLFSIAALIIITSLVACTKPVSETSVETSETNTTVTSETTSETLFSVTNEKDTSSTKGEPHTTKTTTESNINKSTTETSDTTSQEATTSRNSIFQTTETASEKATTTTKPTTKPETTKVVPALPSYMPEEEMIELFNAINNYRTENGLNKLSLDPQLCKLAYIRAQEQELMEGHTRPNGSRFFTILGEYDYSYITCGENIALIWGSPSARPFELWKTSETHNENMLESKWTKTGIAMYQNSDGRYNIVQLFAH